MSATRDDLDRPRDASASREDNGAARGARGARVARGRALALVVALFVLAVLGTGWLADNLTTAPQTPTSGALTRQVGLATVALTVSPSPLAAHQPESLLLRVTDTTGAAVTGAHIECALSMRDMGMALPTVVAKPTAQPGVYVCAAQSLDSGAWALGVTMTLPSGETGHTTFPLSVA